MYIEQTYPDKPELGTYIIREGFTLDEATAWLDAFNRDMDGLGVWDDTQTVLTRKWATYTILPEL